MTRMRHPAEDVTKPIDVPDEAVSMHRMSGWLTDDEWTRAGYPEPPEAEPEDEEPQDYVPEGPGKQQKTKSRRRAPRATDEGNDD